MAAPKFHCLINGNVKKISKMYAKVNGTWKSLSASYSKVGGGGGMDRW